MQLESGCVKDRQHLAVAHCFEVQAVNQSGADVRKLDRPFLCSLILEHDFQCRQSIVRLRGSDPQSQPAADVPPADRIAERNRSGAKKDDNARCVESHNNSIIPLRRSAFE